MMRFFVVAALAVLAGGAEAGVITMSEDLSLGGRFFPEAIDGKGELIYFDNTDIGGGGAVWLSADGYENNHLERQYEAGGYRYGIKRIPGAVVDESEFATVDWIQHHRDGVLEFGGNDSRGLVEFFAESDEVLDSGYLEITLRNDWEYATWKVNGELLYEHTTGQSNLQTFRYDLPTGVDGLRFDFAGSGTADGVIERIEYHEYSTVPEPGIGDLLDLIGNGIGGLIGW
jgi:hypothetical protein